MDWMIWGQNQKMQGNLAKYRVALREAREERNACMTKLYDTEFLKEQWRTHYSAEKALRIAAMEELDKACGGSENNPLRAQAYKDADSFRIPVGKRKGEVVTKADHIFLSKIREKFHERYLGKWSNCKEWISFINDLVY